MGILTISFFFKIIAIIHDRRVHHYEETKDKKNCNNRCLIGEEQFTPKLYINPTHQKYALANKIICCDFKAYVCGFNAGIDTAKFEFQQVSNHCECQYKDESVFVFKILTALALSAWLNLPINTGALLVAHCGGIFNYQFLHKHFLSKDVPRIKS